MKAAGFVNFGSDLEDPNFAQLANSCGFLGLRVDKVSELRPELARFLAHDGLALLDGRSPAPGTLNASNHNSGAGEGIRTLLAPSCLEWARR